jgi:hypothetical protein
MEDAHPSRRLYGLADGVSFRFKQADRLMPRIKNGNKMVWKPHTPICIRVITVGGCSSSAEPQSLRLHAPGLRRLTFTRAGEPVRRGEALCGKETSLGG